MTPAQLLDRIERMTNAIYDRATYDSRTQAGLRQIRADVDALRSSLALPEGWDG